jgi:hypothetical protein
MIKETKQLMCGAVIGVLLAVVVLAIATGCNGQATSADARVRSALDLLAVVVDPAYKMAMDSCVSRESLLADQAETGRLTVVEADKQLTGVRRRCERQRRIFEDIREGHDEAVKLVEAGAVADAEKTLERVRYAWQDLAAGGEP